MDSPVSPIAESPRSLRNRALGIIATASVLAILYLGRDVLVPITLAFILSLLIAPLVRLLRRFGLSQTFAVMSAVLLLSFTFSPVPRLFAGSSGDPLGDLDTAPRPIRSPGHGPVKTGKQPCPAGEVRGRTETAPGRDAG